MNRENRPRVGAVDALEILRRAEEADPKLAAGVAEARRKLRLGIQIQDLREKAGLTQTELARMIGTSQPAVARIESAEYERLSLTTLLKIGRALGLTLEIGFKPKKRSRKPKRTATQPDVG